MDKQELNRSRRLRTKELLSAASAGLYEREEAVKLAFLAAAAGESVFMLGPPGVAKSLVARRLKHCFKGAKSFEYLMGRFSTPEEVFGPISISKLKNEDKYERLVDSYLPGADVAFLDEIWKASPPIQNSLLTAINEKIYRNGEREIKMPLKALIAASNELPPDGQGLEALWDRFLVRLYVDNISSEHEFRSMVTDAFDAYSGTVPEKLMVDGAEWTSWREEIKMVSVPSAVLDVVEGIRKLIAARNGKRDDSDEEAPESIYVSDRRWKKIIGLLRACAWLDGRDAVDIADCLLIRHCIWSRDEEREECRSIVETVVRDLSYSGQYPIREVREAVCAFDQEIKTAIYSEAEEFKPVFSNGYYCLATTKDIDTPQYGNLKGYSIPENEYNELNETETKPINLFDSRSRRLQIQARKGRDGFIEVDYSGTTYELAMEGRFIKQKVRSGAIKSADRIRWDKQRNELSHEIENILAAVGKHRDSVSEVVKEHCFIVPADSHLAFDNLNSMSSELRKLEIDLDRIGKEYAS